MPRIMLTQAQVEHAKMLDRGGEALRQLARDVRDALAIRECVRCLNPLEDWQTYPICRQCAEIKGYDLR